MIDPAVDGQLDPVPQAAEDELVTLRRRLSELDATRAGVAADDELLREAEKRRQENAKQYGAQIRAGLPRSVRLSAPEPFSPPAQLGLVVRQQELRRPGGQMRCEIARDGKITLIYAKPPPLEPDLSPEAVAARISARLPERYQDVTWLNLAELRGPEGLSALGVVLGEDGEPFQGRDAACHLYDRMRKASKVVLIGESRAGKTIAAAAALRAELERGNDRAQWVHASALKEPEGMARALSSSFLVLDDLGYELDGATGGWLHGKRGAAREFLAKWETRRHARLIVTTAFSFDQMKHDDQGYGGAAAQRVYEGAETIRLRR